MSGSVADRFNIGVTGEAAVETGSHFAYMLRVNTGCSARGGPGAPSGSRSV